MPDGSEERFRPAASIEVRLPLSSAAAVAVVVAADALGVEPWEIAVHALALRQRIDLIRRFP